MSNTENTPKMFILTARMGSDTSPAELSQFINTSDRELQLLLYTHTCVHTHTHTHTLYYTLSYSGCPARMTSSGDILFVSSSACDTQCLARHGIHTRYLIEAC